MADSVSRRLNSHGLQGKTIGLKLRLANFDTFTRQATLLLPTDNLETIAHTAQQLLERELRPGRLFRLIGVKVSNFGQTNQLSLFDIAEDGDKHPLEAKH
jgi:DNA polymerase-4